MQIEVQVRVLVNGRELASDKAGYRVSEGDSGREGTYQHAYKMFGKRISGLVLDALTVHSTLTTESEVRDD